MLYFAREIHRSVGITEEAPHLHEPQTDPPKAPSLFRNRTYMTVFVGQMLSSVGSTVYSFALLWDMKITTNSTFLMALVGLGWMLPQVVCGPFAGVLVDRWNKRWTMFWSDAIRLGITALVASLAFAHALNPAEMIASAFVLNSVGALFGPASGALTPLIVGRDQLAAANGLEQSAGPLSNILGPAISAALIAWQGVPMSYAVNALSFLISVATLLAIRVGEPERVKKPFGAKQFFTEMGEGLKTVRTIRLLVAILPFAFVLNFLLAPLDLYMVQFVTAALHRTQVALGELNSFFALGMIAGALTVGLVSKILRSGYLMTGGILLTNIAIMAMALSSWLPAVLGFSFLAGVCLPWVNIPIMTMVQMMVPQELRGRVFSLLGSLFGAAMPLGMLYGGFAAHIFPIRGLLLAVSGANALLAVSMICIPTVRHADLGKASAVPEMAASG